MRRDAERVRDLQLDFARMLREQWTSMPPSSRGIASEI